jgi:hypothetical protein
MWLTMRQRIQFWMDSGRGINYHTLPDTAALLRKHSTNSLPSVTLDKQVSVNCTSTSSSLPSTFYRALDKDFVKCHLVLTKKSRCHGAKWRWRSLCRVSSKTLDKDSLFVEFPVSNYPTIQLEDELPLEEERDVTSRRTRGVGHGTCDAHNRKARKVAN